MNPEASSPLAPVLSKKPHLRSTLGHSPYAKSRARAHLPATNFSMRFTELEMQSNRLASRESASIAAETINPGKLTAASSVKRRQLLKMQGSQIIDSKYGPIHQRNQNAALLLNPRSNVRGS